MLSVGAASLAAQLIDDEALFAAYVCQRERPHVVVALRSVLQETGREIPVTWQMREAETDCALEILGCTWEQWGYPDADPPWREIEADLRAYAQRYEAVWAPLPEEDGGHPHHDALGRLAALLWPQARFYTTYRNGRERTRGRIIEHTAEQEQAKLRALECYTTQRLLWSTRHHFDSALDEPVEYEATIP